MLSPTFGEFMGTMVWFSWATSNRRVALARSKARWRMDRNSAAGVRSNGGDSRSGVWSKDAHITRREARCGRRERQFSTGAVRTAQMLGGLLRRVLVWLHFLPHWAGTLDPSELAASAATPISTSVNL